VFPATSHQFASWTLDLSRIYYFAFVSLTTVGFGDIVAVTPPAQMATVALSVSGPLYLAVVMGLLISRYTVQTETVQTESIQTESVSTETQHDDPSD
jgi:cytochrome c-type biogenesis protein CcmH/NrfF